MIHVLKERTTDEEVLRGLRMFTWVNTLLRWIDSFFYMAKAHKHLQAQKDVLKKKCTIV